MSNIKEKVYEALLSNGLSKKQADALYAEIGRENGFQEKYIFGAHTDANNRKTNYGLISWQGDRKKNLDKYLETNGAYKNGMLDKDKALDLQVKFLIKEMNTNPAYQRTKKQFLENPDVDYNTAKQILGKNFIGWDYNNLKYKAHHSRRDAYYNEVSGDGAITPQSNKKEEDDNFFYNNKKASEDWNVIEDDDNQAEEQQQTEDDEEENNNEETQNEDEDEDEQEVEQENSLEELKQKEVEKNLIEELYATDDEEQGQSEERQTPRQNSSILESYQQISDFIDNPIMQQGGIVKDNKGYWNPDNFGKKVEIEGGKITMKGVNQPLKATPYYNGKKGQEKIMFPNNDYIFKGADKVIESPLTEKEKEFLKEFYN